MSAIRWSFLSGDTSTFAIELSFLTDDVDDHMVDEDERASWGSLRLWVNGRNLCLHEEQGEVLMGAHWYLLPTLEWLVENWDPLFHEERLPFAELSDDASRAARESQRRAFNPAGDVDWDAADRVYEWRSRHSIRTAAEGGLFPDLWFRRWREEFEIAVGLSRVPGTPNHFRYVAEGVWRVDVEAAADALFNVVSAASTYLLSLRPSSTRLLDLQARAATLTDGEKRYLARFAWLSGYNADLSIFNALWKQVDEVLAAADADVRGESLGQARKGQLVLSGAKVALLFGSASPTLTEADVATLTALSVHRSRQPATLPSELGLPVDDYARLTPGEEGSDWGEEVYGQFVAGKYDDEQFVDIERWLADWQVDTREIQLEDRKLRGVSLIDVSGRATIALNQLFERGSSGGTRRFTLAHELAHLLLDRDQGLGLAITSGPWAPRSVEQRANAFAAALLMPRPLLSSAITKSGGHPSDFETSQAIASTLQVSIGSLADRLYNLNFVSRDEADLLKGRAAARTRALRHLPTQP